MKQLEQSEYVVPESAPMAPEGWVTKADIAAHYRFTTRWVESQVARGMPSRLISGRRRFRLSEVDEWLERQELG